MFKRITIILLGAAVLLGGICYAAGHYRWFCPTCGTTISYDTPVERPTDKDIQAAGPCYDFAGNRRNHRWYPGD